MEFPEDPNTNIPLLPNPAAYVGTAKSSAYDEFRNFRISLKWCALDHSSLAGKAVSYTTFVLLTIVIPVVTSLSIQPTPSTGPVSLNRLVHLPSSALATISFLTLSIYFGRYGLRQLLLLDSLRADSACVRQGYARELDRAFRHLAYILLPSFLVELAHKIIFFSAVSVRVPQMYYMLPLGIPCNSVAFVATLASWVYRTGVFLLVCVLFRLTCELQILRLEGFYNMFEDPSHDAMAAIFSEHLRIKRQLLLTSHRYRIFVIACLVTITVTQLGSLVLVFTSKSHKNFCNSGDLVVCSVVQVSGFLMCLFGAARITHRAQRVVSIASRWHVIMSCSSSSSKPDASPQSPMPTIKEPDDALDGSDPKLSDASILPPSSKRASTWESRQALVMYLQHNRGGITLYGFALDRGLLHTLFAFELTLVLWILGKVIVVS